MNTEQVSSELIMFIREEFLWGDADSELNGSSPLLEWGIIDSLRIALLLAHIQERYGVHIDLATLSARNFHDVDTISGIVCGIAARGAGTNVAEKETA